MVDGDESVEARVREIVREVLEPTDANRLPPDADLWANGLNSLGSVSLLVRLEEEFEVEFPDEALNRTTFASVRSILDTMLELLR